MVAKESKLEKRLNELKMVDRNHTFAAGGRTKVLEPPGLYLRGSEPFIDTYKNPALKRGELNPQPVVSSKPFVASVGGNKSSVLPNTLFDTIAEAEETGGAAKRHLGISSRFGVADNTDCRAPPFVPLHSSSDCLGASGSSYYSQLSNGELR